MGAGGSVHERAVRRRPTTSDRQEAGVNVFAISHGETAWSLSGRHTGTTDIPLTDNGRRLAERMRSVLAGERSRSFSSSPCSGRAETCERGSRQHGRHRPRPSRVELRRVRGTDAQADPRDGAGLAIFGMDARAARPRSRSGAVDRVIARRARPRATSRCSRTAMSCACSRPAGSAARGGGQHFLLDTGTLSVLGCTTDIPAVRIWNGPLMG